MSDRRTLVEILFSRKRPVENFPRLHGQQPIRRPARRNRGRARLSAMLCKGLVVALKGDVRAIGVLESPDGVMVRSRSQSGGGIHASAWVGGEVWLPYGVPTYHLALLSLAEALAHPEWAGDLLDALEVVLARRDEHGEGDQRYVDHIAHLSDEAYFYLRYRERAPTAGNDRLTDLALRDARALPRIHAERALDPRLLTDVGRLREHRGGVTRVGEAPPREASVAGSAFRGWQLAELIETLDLGMNAILIGPTATGKTLCVHEAVERLRRPRPMFTLEGHESLREHDLLGCYVPVGANDYRWRDGVVVQAMKAGGILFVDEANRMTTRTLNVLLGIISRRAVVLTEHGSEEVRAKEGFAVILAMNLGRGYAVNVLDTALVNRFQVMLDFRYLPPAEEVDLVVAHTGIAREIAGILVKVANETRARRRNHELSGEITPRQLFAWAEKWRARREDDLLSALQAAARVTWLPAVVGTDAAGYVREDLTAEMMTLIEAHTPVSLDEELEGGSG